LHTKLGNIKYFVKGMDNTGRGFEYVRNKFPNVSDAKIKEGIFIGHQIKELMQDKQFDEDLNETERNAWLSFKRTCKDFLGNKKAPNYQDAVRDLLTLYTSYGMQCESENPLYGVTLGFFFPENLDEISDEHGERFHHEYGQAIPRQVDLNYVGRLLLDTDEVCT
jgi:hypothetical protein